MKRLSLVPLPLSSLVIPRHFLQSLSEKEPTFLKNHSDTGPDGPILENYTSVVVTTVSPVENYRL